MSMPEELRRMLHAALEQDEVLRAKAEKIQARMTDGIVEKGLRLSPAGLNAAISIAATLVTHSHKCNDHGRCGETSSESALEILDEFILVWVIQRLAEDPNALEQVRMAILPDTARLFLGETDEVKVV